MKVNNLFIAYGLTQEEALTAQRNLASTMNCAQENITITTAPTVIYSLRADEKAVVGVKAHATDQSQWSKLMPICRHMKAKNVKFQIIK